MSLTFDGIDDVVTESAGTIGNDQVTMFVTCNPIDLGEATRGFLMAHGTGVEGGTGPRYVLMFDDNTSGYIQALRFSHRRNTTSGNWRVNSLPTLGVWQSFAVTYDQASTANDAILYKNGVALTTTRATTPTGPNTVAEPVDVYCGNNSTGARTFNGQIGTAAMWNRILDPSEIALVHFGGVRKVLRGLKIWLRGVNTPTIYPDWSGGAYTGTVSGAVVSADATGTR